MSSTPRSTTLFDALDLEWDHLSTRIRSRKRFSEWQQRESVLRPFADPGECVEALFDVRRRGMKDEILTSLMRQRPDALAARLLLQAFRPSMKTTAATLIAEGLDHDEVVAVVVATTWERLVTYPIETRPHGIAKGVTLDVRRDATRTLQQEPWPTAEPVRERAITSGRTPDDELLAAIVAAVTNGILTPADAALVADRIIGEKSIRWIAAERLEPYRATVDSLQRAGGGLLGSLP